jgi:superfamily II DNA or RNA helicase
MDAMRLGNSTLVVMATGLGKTIVFAEIIRRYMMTGTGRRALVLAHRAELIHQAAHKIGVVAGCDVEIEMGELRARESTLYRAPVIVSSVQTQTAGRNGSMRMHKFNPKQFGIVIIDEAHHAVGDSYRKTLDHFKQGGCRVLGVTATPDRADEAALGSVFDSVAFEFGIREGIEAGWLVPIRQRLVSVTSLDYSSCRTTAGDLNGADLDSVMQYEENLHGMVYPTLEISGDRRGIIFASSVSHAERITEIVNRHKPSSAVFVCAATPTDERRSLFAGFAEGRYQWLVNVGVATEGWDDAALDRKGVQIIAMMRPTKSRALYCQMIGRGTRPLPRTVDGIADAQSRRAAIASSAKDTKH